MLTVDQALAAVLENPGAAAGPAVRWSRRWAACWRKTWSPTPIRRPFDKALVDGYAVRSGDLAGQDRRLAVGETIMAGQMPSRALGRGEAAVIMTGHPLPTGCDAVVMHERTQPRKRRRARVGAGGRAGQNVLRRGREMGAGEVVVARGSILEPARLGVLAAVGRTEVMVVPRPLVAIVPTGDELVEPGQVPGPGQIRNSNAVMLDALAIEAGARDAGVADRARRAGAAGPGPRARARSRSPGRHRRRVGRPARSCSGGPRGSGCSSVSFTRSV